MMPLYYKQQTIPDHRFRDLAKSLRVLLDGLYFLPFEYHQAWKADRDSFLYLYSKLLKGLNVYLNPYWLNRQIKCRDLNQSQAKTCFFRVACRFSFFIYYEG